MHRNKSNHAHAHRDAYWHTYLYAYTSGPFEWDMKVTFCVKACIRSCMHVKCLLLRKVWEMDDTNFQQACLMQCINIITSPGLALLCDDITLLPLHFHFSQVRWPEIPLFTIKYHWMNENENISRFNLLV